MLVVIYHSRFVVICVIVKNIAIRWHGIEMIHLNPQLAISNREVKAKGA